MKKIICVMLFITICIWGTALMPESFSADAISENRFNDIYETTGEFLQETKKTAVGSVNGEWKILGLARAGLSLPASEKNGYLKSVEEYIDENIDGNGKLDINRSTENSRIILALTAIGENPRDFEGHNLAEALTDMDFVTRQGINGPIWALIALNSGGCGSPEMLSSVTDELVIYILSEECPSGGWALFGSDADPDITAMAIQALAPYYLKNEDVKGKVDAGLNILSEMQDGSGAYYSWGSLNVESTAQVIVAVTSLGIDPQSDSRFIKGGKTLIDGLEMFYCEGGGFRHILEGERDGMATEQGYYALASYARMKAGKTSLYDMSDVTMEEASNKDISIEKKGMVGWSLIVLAAGAGILMTRKKKNAA